MQHSVDLDQRLQLIMVYTVLVSFARIEESTRHERIKFEPPHDKTNKIVCGPNEDSHQPGIWPV